MKWVYFMLLTPLCFAFTADIDRAWFEMGNSQVYIPGQGLVSYDSVYPPVTTSTFSSPVITDCNGMVDKLYLAAQDMKTWDRDSWNNPDPCGNNACCSMNEQVDGRRACSIGMPGSRCGNAYGCCGAYIWHLFDIAIHKHGVAMQWPYKGEGSTQAKPNSFWPGNMVGVEKIQLRENGQTITGTDVHSQLKTGDLLYLQWENDDDNTGCQYNSHVLMVGKIKGDSFEYIDSGNYRNGVSRSTVRDYLDYRQECGARIQRKDSPRVWIWRSPLCK